MGHLRQSCRLGKQRCYYCQEYGHSDRGGHCPKRPENGGDGIENANRNVPRDEPAIPRVEVEQADTSNSNHDINIVDGVGVAPSASVMVSEPVIKPVDASHGVCIICVDSPREIMYIPCNHIVVCMKCDKELYARQFRRDCIVCRKEVRNRFRVYL